MDPRVSKAQQLFWETAALKNKGELSAARPKFAEMGKLHQDRAEELLQAGNADGWIDFYAAVTAWGEAGEVSKAKELIQRGEQVAAAFSHGRDNIKNELAELQKWLATLPTPINGATKSGFSSQRGEGVA